MTLKQWFCASQNELQSNEPKHNLKLRSCGRCGKLKPPAHLKNKNVDEVFVEDFFNFFFFLNKFFFFLKSSETYRFSLKSNERKKCWSWDFFPFFGCIEMVIYGQLEHISKTKNRKTIFGGFFILLEMSCIIKDHKIKTALFEGRGSADP